MSKQAYHAENNPLRLGTALMAVTMCEEVQRRLGITGGCSASSLRQKKGAFNPGTSEVKFDFITIHASGDTVTLPEGSEALVENCGSDEGQVKKLVRVPSKEHMILMNAKSFWKAMAQVTMFLEEQVKK